MNNFQIIVNKPLSDETLMYISDCWIEFVCCELALNPSDLLMIIPDLSTEREGPTKSFAKETQFKMPRRLFWLLIDYFNGKTETGTEIIQLLETKLKAIGNHLEYMEKLSS